MQVNIVIYLLKLLSSSDRLITIIDKDIEKREKEYNEILYSEETEKDLSEPIFSYGTFTAKENVRKIIAYIELNKSEDFTKCLLKMLKKSYPYLVSSYKKGMNFKAYYSSIDKMCPPNIIIYTISLYLFLCEVNGVQADEIENADSGENSILHELFIVITQRNDKKFFINKSSEYDISHFKKIYDVLKTKGDLETREKLGAIQSLDALENIFRCCGIFSNDVDSIKLTNKEIKFAVKTVENFLYPSEMTIKQLDNTKKFYIDGKRMPESYDSYDILEYIAKELLTLICSIIQLSKDYTKMRAFSEESVKKIYALKNNIDTLEEKYNNRFSDKENKLLQEINSLKEQLNDAQIKYDKLNVKYIDEKSKTELLEEMLEHQHNDSVTDEVGKNNTDEEVVSYPENTILWGGNPRWQKFFIQQHPEIIKVISGTERNAPIEIFSDKANLILINTGHMAHASYYKYMPYIKRIGVKYIFV